MKQWQVTQLASPYQALSLSEVALPVPQGDELLVKVEAVALNFSDVLLCRGTYQEHPPLPFVAGRECAGTVVSLGPDASFPIGSRVACEPVLPHGAFSEYVTVAQPRCMLIPDDMLLDDAAALLLTYQTAFTALTRRAHLAAGETLLVHGGAGGVGSADIQMGRALGAQVIATAGSDRKLDHCRQLGADHVINYRAAPFAPHVREITGGVGADVIIDPIGGRVLEQSLRCIAFEGRLVSLGFASGQLPTIAVNHIFVKNYSVLGLHWGLYERRDPQWIVKCRQQLLQLYREGAIRPLISVVGWFDELPERLEQLAQGATEGKVVLRTRGG